MTPLHPIFRSFVQAGFECSSHKLRSGERLDLIQSTQHDRFAREDYRRLRELGITTVRIGARWHVIEASPGEYNFESVAVLLDAAAETGIEVILDLLHFGWPDHVQVFEPSFADDFGRFTRALTTFLKRHHSDLRMFAPVNEISFLAWAGGDKGGLNPHAVNRGPELKRALVRAAVAASEVLLNELPQVRLISPEPVIHIVGDSNVPGDDVAAENYRLSQFQSWDMLSGRLDPELGGKPEYLDIIGVNFYDRNQWAHNFGVLARTDPRYRAFHKILEEIWNRYRRPVFVSETGTENDKRAEWFNYVSDEVFTALTIGVPVYGICLYPILNHPGWDDGRHCYNGLFDYADASGNREIYWPLAHAIFHQQQRFARSKEFKHDPQQYRSDLPVPSALGFRLPAPSASNEPVRAQ